MNNLEEFEIAYNKYTGRDTSAPVERLKHPVPGITYKYQYANDMLAFWNAARAGLIAQLEAAQKRGDDIDENRKVAFELYQNTANRLEAANEKLSKPVVLPVGYAVRAGHPINEGERNVMIPKEGGNWLSRFDVEHAIRVAGFIVEGE
ncbi:TPA: hypothetical protein PXJ64_003265 [Yersinia enterocolitica]|nr:hypothetical protein [Yersinia enterocolitica]EKN5984813.1 hypothetical protein [Yersinia enterocolitica]EKN5988764.1 hypothetical protein [Yersinia enterocolitica]ELX2243046.1 hypothetical protein [Yersinia enterocolitica]HDL6717146.1 hypothetical protein [Yersinia enterocolitica]